MNVFNGNGSELASIAPNSSRIQLNRFSLRNVWRFDAFRFVLGVIAGDSRLASRRVGFVHVCDFHFACRTIGDFFVQVLVLDIELGRELDFAVGRHDGRDDGVSYLYGPDKSGRQAG